MSALDQKTTKEAYDHYFEQFSGQFSPVPSPQGREHVNSSQEHLSKLIKVTRDHQCARTMLQYEKDKLMRPSQADVRKRTSPGSAHERTLFGKHANGHGGEETLRSFEDNLTTGQRVLEPQRQSANTQKILIEAIPAQDAAALRVEQAESVLLPKGNMPQNADLIAADSPRLNSTQFDRTQAEYVNSKVGDIDLDERLVHSHVVSTQGRSSQLTNTRVPDGPLLVKHPPHGANESMLVPAHGYTSSHLKSMKARFKEEDEGAALELAMQ